jgi:hypothetical protein
LTELKAAFEGLLVDLIYIFFTFGVFNALAMGDSDFFAAFLPSVVAILLMFLLFYLPNTVCRD